MGAHIEMVLQCMRVPYKIEAFNQEEVIYVIDSNALGNRMPKQVDGYIAFWYGMTKPLVNAMWSLWEEADGTTEDKMRIKIAKKLDKFCWQKFTKRGYENVCEKCIQIWW